METLFPAYRDIIPEFSLFQESLRRPFPIHLRINGLKVSPNGPVARLKARGYGLEKATVDADNLYFVRGGLSSPGNLTAYDLGHIHPQALTSCLAALALGPSRGSFILDMCAAPGGKTSHLAELNGNTGLIVANELHPSRQIPLGHTLNRLGVLNSILTGYQAQEFPLKSKYDFILADVPCSAEGKFRKLRADAVYRVTRGKRTLPDLQKKIILRGFDLLKDDGQMLYATCTYHPQENEAVVHHLLKRRPATLLPLNLETPHEPGILRWREETYDTQLERAARFYPHRVDSVGFFMAKIGKRA